MAIRNAFKGGTDFVEEGLKPSDQNDTFDAFFVKSYGDNTGGSISSSTTETDLATITVTQNDFGSSASLVINTGIAFSNNGSAGAGTFSGTFRLYVNGIVVKTVVMTAEFDGTGSTTNTSGTSIPHFATSIDSTAGNVIVKVSAQNDASGTGVTSLVTGLTVQGINNNN